MSTNENWVIAALYHFARFERYETFQAPLAELCDREGIVGTLLLASEGINGTVSGPRGAIDTLLTFLREQPEFTSLEHKESFSPRKPFRRMKVRLKKEIVTMGVPGTDPTQIVGTYLGPREWDQLITDPDTVVVDTRNDYEVRIGTFANAINPHTETFREFPDWVKRNENALKGKKIAMFCTGGIRCEKATAFVKELGHEHVFHLKGGILKYLEEVPASESTWEGECFVFDERVSVGHGLKPGDYTLCRACREPVSAQDRKSPDFVEGVSCSHCIDRFTPEDRQRFAERQHQMDLAKKRGEDHIGSDLDERRERARKAREEARERSRRAEQK